FAGSEFYSSRPETRETLKVDEIERVQCSGSCGLFSKLKEAYLFGCDSLKPEPLRLASGDAEPNRELMRRLFPGVPVIYGFSSLAPYGRVAGPMLERFFEAGGVPDVASGVPSDRLLRLFGPASMTVASGAGADPMCRYHDERIDAGQKLAWLAAELAGDMPSARMAFERMERFLAGLSADDRAGEAFIASRESLARDAAARDSYLSLVRATGDPALRVRMASVARDIGWLDESAHRMELARTIRDMVAADAIDFGDVDLICALNKDDALAKELRLFNVATLARAPARDAAWACMGDATARAKALAALASADEGDVRMAQAFLRHRPIIDAAELRDVAAGVARMKASAAQVRAIETLARQHVSDAQVLDRLAILYSGARSVEVQRAVAEVFLRSDLGAIDARALAARLKRDRLREDALIDMVITRLNPS
ncbi:MAG TPA: hypothetical protein VKF60_07435, partial [Myxococcota bacterium]|nr:hypothetical protein [Myxococcota bacterium]